MLNVEGISLLAHEISELARCARHLDAELPLETFTPVQLPYIMPLHTDGIVMPFIGPQMKIMRAAIHLDALVNIFRFYSSNTKLVAKEVGFEDPNVIWEITFSNPPPAAVPLLIGDTAHNLRSALDLMVCDLARLQGKNPKGLKFPFAETEEKLEEILGPMTKGLGSDVVGAIRALKPFAGPGGNRLLRGLHDLDVVDKHRLIIPAYVASWQRYDMAGVLTDMIKKTHPDFDEKNVIIFVGDTNVPFKNGERIKRKRGEEPLKHYAPKGISALFPAEHSPFPRQEVVPLLAQLHKMAVEIVSGFETQFYRPNPNP